MINKRLASNLIFKGRIINLRVDDVELPDGRRTTREIVEHPGAVVIVPLGDDGRVHLVRQYRDAVAETLLELPAGKLEGEEPPQECARRELAEELGYEAEEWRKLAEFYTSPGFCDEKMYVYLARRLRKLTMTGDSEEFIEAESRPLLPLDDLLVGIRDGKSIAAILLAHRVVEEANQ